MCVIIEKPPLVGMSIEDITTAQESNRNGFGYMLADDGVLFSEKGLDWTPESIFELVKANQDKLMFLHFRTRTHGKVNADNCHPFYVLNREEHGIDLAVMHNGSVSNVMMQEDESDTNAYVRQVLTPLLADNPFVLQEAWFKRLVDNTTGTWSLFSFLDCYGNHMSTRVTGWEEYNDLIVSNGYSFRSYVAPTTTYGTNRTYNNAADTSGLAGDEAPVMDNEEYWMNENIYGSGYEGNLTRVGSKATGQGDDDGDMDELNFTNNLEELKQGLDNVEIMEQVIGYSFCDHKLTPDEVVDANALIYSGKVKKTSDEIWTEFDTESRKSIQRYASKHPDKMTKLVVLEFLEELFIDGFFDDGDSYPPDDVRAWVKREPGEVADFIERYTTSGGE